MMKKIGVGLMAFGAAAMANATVDVTAITAAATDVTAVGVAVFGVYVTIKAIKFVRRAL